MRPLDLDIRSEQVQLKKRITHMHLANEFWLNLLMGQLTVKQQNIIASTGYAKHLEIFIHRLHTFQWLRFTRRTKCIRYRIHIFPTQCN